MTSKNSKTLIIKSEQSTRFLVHAWTKGCRKLYGAMGVYTVYEHETDLCLYIGQSIDLGKRVRRFFSTNVPGLFIKDKKKAHFTHTTSTGKLIRHYPIYLEITTIANVHHLDRFERTMIAIKRPAYNQLLNYDRTVVKPPLGATSTQQALKSASRPPRTAL